MILTQASVHIVWITTGGGNVTTSASVKTVYTLIHAQRKADLLVLNASLVNGVTCAHKNAICLTVRMNSAKKITVHVQNAIKASGEVHAIVVVSSMTV